MSDFVCGIELKNFKHQPTPEELGAIVAGWNSEDQAMFFICMGEGLRNRCGGKHFMQWQYIADSIKETEGRLLDGSASELIEEIACRLPDAVGEARTPQVKSAEPPNPSTKSAIPKSVS